MYSRKNAINFTFKLFFLLKSKRTFFKEMCDSLIQSKYTAFMFCNDTIQWINYSWRKIHHLCKRLINHIFVTLKIKHWVHWIHNHDYLKKGLFLFVNFIPICPSVEWCRDNYNIFHKSTGDTKLTFENHLKIHIVCFMFSLTLPLLVEYVFHEIFSWYLKIIFWTEN